MTRKRGIWRVLDIEPTRDTRAIRRAYATQLKITHPEDDAEGFQRLREAYEWALQYAATPEGEDQYHFDAEEEVASAPEPAASEPEAAPPDAGTAEDAPPPDPDMEAAHAAYRRLEASLSLEDLESLLGLPELQRFDILQRVEAAVAYLLADSSPRSDALLARAADFFEWRERADDRALPQGVPAVLARLADLDFLRGMQSSEWSQSYLDKEAFGRLMNPPSPFMRWTRAHVFQSVDELKVLNRIRDHHPGVLDTIPEGSREWWHQFEHGPRPGVLLALTLSFIGNFAVWIGRGAPLDSTNPLLDFALFLGTVIFSAAAIAAFNLFVVDLPARRLREHWRGYPPAFALIGWLPASLALMVLTALTRNMPVLAWLLAALNVAVMLGLVLVMNAMPPRESEQSRGLRGSLVTRALSVNFFAGLWLAWLMYTLPEFPSSLVVSIVAALLASGMGREHQLEFFDQALTPKSRRALLIAAFPLLMLLIHLVIKFGDRPEAQFWLIAVVMAVVVLRRAVPFGLDMSGFGNFTFWIVGVILLNGLRRAYEGFANFGAAGPATSDDRYAALATGAMVFLVGAGITFGVRLYQDRKQAS